MKRSFFIPMLCLGIVLLVGGYCSMLLTFQEMKTREASLSNFIAQYEDANDYEALFSEAVRIYEDANFYHSENTATSASGVVLGIFLVLWAFERRKMLRKLKEVQQARA